MTRAHLLGPARQRRQISFASLLEPALGASQKKRCLRIGVASPSLAWLLPWECCWRCDEPFLYQCRACLCVGSSCQCCCSAPVLGSLWGHLARQPSSTLAVKLHHCAAGAAMSLFESLELWDALILCYRMLQKVPQAKALVLARLQVSLHVVREWLAFTWAAQGGLPLDNSWCCGTAGGCSFHRTLNVVKTWLLYSWATHRTVLDMHHRHCLKPDRAIITEVIAFKTGVELLRTYCSLSYNSCATSLLGSQWPPASEAGPSSGERAATLQGCRLFCQAPAGDFQVPWAPSGTAGRRTGNPTRPSKLIPDTHARHCCVQHLPLPWL